MKFCRVADVFDGIENQQGRTAKTELLAQLLTESDPDEAAIIVYLSLGRLAAPHRDIQFNIARKHIITLIARVLEKEPAEIERLVKQHGDAGLVIEMGASAVSGSLDLMQVYTALHEVGETSGTGSQEEKLELLGTLLRKATPVEAKYIVRMVLGKLRLGFSDMTLIDALSWMVAGDKSLRTDIESAYNVCADLGHIATVIKCDGVDALEKIQVKVGVPIRPAAAERLPTARAIIEKLGICVAQPKLDGFRVQIHLDLSERTPRMAFFSRNLQDMSHMFPDVCDALQELKAEQVICEGEAIAFDPNTGSFRPFQETARRRRKHDIAGVAQDIPLKVFLFDLLYVDGESLLGESHAARRKRLLEITDGVDQTRVAAIGEKIVSTAQELEDYFAHSISTGLEGVVVKRPDSPYTPGKRNFNWIKLKRQEEGHLEDTVDCVILGYYAGQGKRAAFGIGAFLVGVYNKVADQFETIAKIGTGLSDTEWKSLKKQCDEHMVSRRPSEVVCAKDLVPDVWVRPEIVCLVRADEITLSPVHSAGRTDDQLGFALRFPRIMGFREDKGPNETTTVAEIARLYEDQFIA